MSLTTPPEIPIHFGDDGIARVGTTRVTLDTVIHAFSEGATAEEIAQQYPSLKLADIYFAIGYYLSNPTEVEDYLRNRKMASETTREENESRFDPQGIRERLLTRRGTGD